MYIFYNSGDQCPECHVIFERLLHVTGPETAVYKGEDVTLYCSLEKANSLDTCGITSVRWNYQAEYIAKPTTVYTESNGSLPVVKEGFALRGGFVTSRNHSLTILSPGKDMNHSLWHCAVDTVRCTDGYNSLGTVELTLKGKFSFINLSIPFFAHQFFTLCKKASRVISTSGFQVFPRWLQCKTVHFQG